MDDGWVKTYRKLLKWEWFTDSHMVHLLVYLILSANHETRKWKGIDILPGQFVTGRKKMSRETGISDRSLRTCIERLKSTNEITIKSTNKYSIITIVNWATYQTREYKNDQKNDQQNDKQPTSNRPATDHKQELKNEKKEDIYMLPKVSGNGHCPHQEIISLYHKHLPMCPQIVKWTDARASHLKTRWSESPEQASLEWWEDLFKQIAQSKFLTGRVTSRNGRPFFASLEWIVKPENFAKILEGKYHE